MIYINYLRLQVIMFLAGFLGLSIGYIIGCYFGWKQPIVLTPDYVVKMIVVSFIFIFVGPLVNKWFVDYLNK
jgi:hypothetical protein